MRRIINCVILPVVLPFEESHLFLLNTVPLGLLQIEDIVTRIQDEKAGGVSIRTVKSFLSKIPSVVSG